MQDGWGLEEFASGRSARQYEYARPDDGTNAKRGE
jgi:hypothetical protein